MSSTHKRHLNDLLARMLADTSKGVLVGIISNLLKDKTIKPKWFGKQLEHFHEKEWNLKIEEVHQCALRDEINVTDNQKKISQAQRGQMPLDHYNGAPVNENWKPGKVDYNKLTPGLSDTALEELYHDWMCIRCGQKGGWACLQHPGVITETETSTYIHGVHKRWVYRRLWTCCGHSEEAPGCTTRGHVYLKEYKLRREQILGSTTNSFVEFVEHRPSDSFKQGPRKQTLMGLDIIQINQAQRLDEENQLATYLETRSFRTKQQMNMDVVMEQTGDDGNGRLASSLPFAGPVLGSNPPPKASAPRRRRRRKGRSLPAPKQGTDSDEPLFKRRKRQEAEHSPL